MASLWVVAYDIADPRRLRRVAKLLERFGERVQESVFECWLGRAARQRLLGLLALAVDPQEDSVRLYPVCAACLVRLRWQGEGDEPGGKDYWLV